MQSKTPKISGRISRRSFVCVACRTQKLKCDRERPTCKRCKRVGRECLYEADASYISPTNSNEASSGNMNSTNRQEYKNDATQIDFANNLEVKLDKKLNLWNARDMIVSHGYQTYFDYPLGTHALAQYDPYTRFFCPSAHGTTLTEIRERLDIITNDAKRTTPGSISFNTNQKVSPIMFIENAVAKWVDKTNAFVNNQMPLEYFNIIYTIDDKMHPTLMVLLKRLIKEIDDILPPKTDTDNLIRDFYENVYPFYPFIEIEAFEEKLAKIIVNYPNKIKYEINVFQENIRFQLEILTLFLLILSITLRNPNIEHNYYHFSKKQSIKLSKQLLIYSQKLLSLLNGFKFTSENILCCLLYIYVAEILNPENAELHITHSSCLTLKCLTELATTLGVFEEPSKFSRYLHRDAPYDSYYMLRRKIWIGLQSLKMEMISADGGCTRLDYKYLDLFLHGREISVPSFMDKFDNVSSFDKQLFTIHANIYQFHMLLNKLMTNCGPLEDEQDLDKILVSIERIKDFTFTKFPLSKLTTVNTNILNHEPRWRGAEFNYQLIERIEILRVNIIFFSSLMNIYKVLEVYFENKCTQNWEKYGPLHRKFSYDCFNCYLQALTLIITYLKGDYSSFILKKHEYSLNKTISYVTVKILSVQLGYLLRLSYKKSMIKGDVAFINRFIIKANVDEHETINPLIESMLGHIVSHVNSLIDVTLSKYDDAYFGIYQVLLMSKYVSYLADNDLMVEVTNDYWRKASTTNEIPEAILDMMTLKWGIGHKESMVIDYYTKNPMALSSFNTALLSGLEEILKASDIQDQLYVKPIRTDLSLNESNIFNQLIETNFDLFCSIIGDNMGDLPTI